MKGKWQRLSLEKCCDFFSGTGFPDRFQGHKSGDYPFIKVSDMSLSGNSIFLVGANNWVSKAVASSLSAKIIPAGATAFAKIGAAMLLNRRRITTQDTCFDNNMMAAVSKENVDSKIIYYIFTTLDFAYFSQITALPSLNLSDLKKYQICLPKLKADQQHIADILSTCDEVIEQTEKTIAKYRDIKAGMLQDLFTRGLDANGKLRPKPEDAPELYKDSPLGKIPKEWDVCCFENFYSIPSRNGLTRPTSVRGHGFKMINMGELFANEFIADIPMDRVPLSNKEQTDYAVALGDLLFARQSLVLEGVGKCVIVTSVNEPTCFESHIIRIRLKDDCINPFLVYYYFWAKIPKLYLLAIQGAQSGIKGSELANVKIKYPVSMKEQELIVDKLSAVDVRISAEERTLSKYCSLKLGLMKKLLTSPEGALEA